jgi:hypothetical protein
MNPAIVRAVAGFSVGCLGIASIAKASVIASDNFNGDTTGAAINNQDGGTGWYGNWFGSSANATAVAGSLAQPAGTAITPSGNSLYLNSSSGSSIYAQRTFGTGSGASAITTTSLNALGDSSDTLYFSYLVQRTNTANNRSVLDLIVPSGGITSGITQIGIGTGLLSGTTDWGIWDDQGGPTGNLAYSTIASTTSSTLIVGAFDLATGVLNIYVDPQGTAMPANPDVSYSFATSSSISLSAIQPFAEGNDNGNATPTPATYGNFTFATTYAEVVPEPSCLALMMLPAAGMLIRRRARRASTDCSSAPTAGNIPNASTSANP